MSQVLNPVGQLGWQKCNIDDSWRYCQIGSCLAWPDRHTHYRRSRTTRVYATLPAVFGTTSTSPDSLFSAVSLDGKIATFATVIVTARQGGKC